ncbi:hypothetical protein [Falsihalocynthiibacter arcticus]|uniref:Uncharacterized protein n=1 Tax=Falsihalocynthiibacter arcticus TaxID=1579316 RepID=A0A126V636_9RHOB|nr:hypothetical protein [Falsihalocynthiibacter arcticus]AML53794.1 hypothetical protein RC74_21305 [Falsihalocynthiibacter arcticus]
MNVYPQIIVASVFLNLSSNIAWADEVNLEGLTWTEQKCVLYQSAWNWAYDSIGPEGVSAEFIAQNDSFMATGCTERTVVCPRSDEELDMANMLTVMTMNEGMASTFVPFTCREEAQ